MTPSSAPPAANKATRLFGTRKRPALIPRSRSRWANGPSDSKLSLQVEADEQPSPVGIDPGEVDEVPVRHRDDFGRVVQVRRDELHRRTVSGDLLAEHGFDDRLLRFEVVVERPEADVRLVGDLVDAGALDALPGKQRFSGVEQLPVGPLAAPRVPVPMWCRRGAAGIGFGRHI